MPWQNYIHFPTPAIMGGKPVVRGTRLTVAFLRELLANGWTAEQVLKEYPQLTPKALKAVESATIIVARPEPPNS